MIYSGENGDYAAGRARNLYPSATAMAQKEEVMPDRRRYPLRKIIGECVNNYTRMEQLEYGHEQPQLQDIYGHTNADSRRCPKCYKEAQVAAQPVCNSTHPARPPRPRSDDDGKPDAT